jgi:hypothetical protein
MYLGLQIQLDTDHQSCALELAILVSSTLEQAARGSTETSRSWQSLVLEVGGEGLRTSLSW